MSSRWLTPLVVAGLLAACQAPLPASWQVGPVAVAAYHERLDVVVGAARSVLATTAEVARLEVRVQDGAGVIARQVLAADHGTASFLNLAPGTATVWVEAYAADDHQLGSTSQLCWVAAGATNHVEANFYLSAPAVPGPGSGGADVAVAIQDGATVAAAPLPHVALLPLENIAYVTADDGDQMLVDRSGGIWQGGTHILPDGSKQTLKGDHPRTTKVLPDGSTRTWNAPGATALAEAPDGSVWVARDGKLERLDPTGAVVASIVAPGAVLRDGLKVDASGQLWASSGDHVYRFDAAGTAQGSTAVPGTAAALAIDPNGGMIWVMLPDIGRVGQLSPAGALLRTTAIASDGDILRDLVLDAQGNAWVSVYWAGCVAKLRPDGSLEGIFPAIQAPGPLAVDPHGRVLVAPDAEMGGLEQMVLLSSEGRRLAMCDFNGAAMQVYDMVFDATGALWVFRVGAIGRVQL